MSYRQTVGKFGETLAKNYLIRHGYKIIGTNIKTSYQEIDIIAYNKGIYVFVEVKLRTTNTYGYADETVYHEKINNLKKAIMSYIVKNNINTINIRLDLIGIDLDKFKKMAKIKHYKSIF